MMQETLGSRPNLTMGATRGLKGARGIRAKNALAADGGQWFGHRYSVMDLVIDAIAPCPWPSMAGSCAPLSTVRKEGCRPLYTAEERRRRDATAWTLVQGILAPVQFGVFLVSVALILNYLWTGQGYGIAAGSVVLKTVVLYLIMITGSIWEKKVFDKYLFAPAFFWEDVMSMLVLAFHTTYLIELFTGWGTPQGLMVLAATAYTSYVINAGQFVLKLRTARLEKPVTRIAGVAARSAK
jgi:3-vinyl bacteriochlorophyllide hydratase